MNASWRGSAFGAIAALMGAAAALAQAPMQAPMPPGPPAANPVCGRLEAQLGAIDRGTVDPARADQIKRYEDSSRQQQADLDRLNAQARRLGCQGGGFFSLFSGQNPQCTPLNQQIQQARGNLEKMLADLDRLQGGAAGDREAQRQTVIAALAQNNCGPQYRAAANQQRGFFDTLFGGGNRSGGGFGGGDSGGGLFSSNSGTYRTVCVRTCDGYYYPISYATTQEKFADDAQTCQQTCPAADVVLMTNRTGEDINQAVSTSGAPYSSLPNAFKYRAEVVPSCGCRRPGQSWAQALGQVRDSTLQGDDIVVTPGVAQKMSQPRDAQGRPIRQDVKTLDPKAAAAAASGAQAAASSNEGDTGAPPDKPKRPVRAVGPTFVPAR
jgi:Protein of unknown function (DUF2865)